MSSYPELAFLGIVSQIKPLIKRIQYVSVAMASGDTTKQASIPIAVDKTKSFPFLLGAKTAEGTDASRFDVRAALDDSTHVSLTRNTASSGAETVTGVIAVVHLHDWAVIGIDHGTITVTAAASAFVTPSFTPSVDKDTICIWLGNTSTLTGDGARLSKHQFDVAYTIGNNRVTATKGTSSESGVVGYCLIQLHSGIIKSKNEALLAIATSGSAVDATATIPAVNMNNTICFPGGFRNTEGFSGQRCAAFLNSTTQLKAERSAAYNFGSSPNGMVRVTTIELYPQYVRKMHRGYGDFTGNAQDVTYDLVNSPDISKTLLAWGGSSLTNAFANADYGFMTLNLSGHTVVFDRDSVGFNVGDIPKPRFEAMEFI